MTGTGNDINTANNIYSFTLKRMHTNQIIPTRPGFVFERQHTYIELDAHDIQHSARHFNTRVVSTFNHHEI
jgi:predicted GNAT family N-acyltransferase